MKNSKKPYNQHELFVLSGIRNIVKFSEHIDNLKKVLGLEDNGVSGLYTELYNFLDNHIATLEYMAGDENEFIRKYIYDAECGRIRRTVMVGKRKYVLDHPEKVLEVIKKHMKYENKMDREYERTGGTIINATYGAMLGVV